MSALLNCSRSLLLSSTLRLSTVSIPNKKVKSPTALLQALANTVEWDPTAGAPYHYIDDPHTLPKTRNEKKEFNLSRASGRASARWFLQTYPWLFDSVESEPKVAAFTPPRHADTPAENTDPLILGKKKNYEQRREERRKLSTSWSSLEVLVSERRAHDAWSMWQALTTSKECKDEHQKLALDLFSLLAFTNLSENSTGAKSVALLEHRYYGNSYDGNVSAPVGNRWASKGPADQMYTWLEDKNLLTAKEHCILIRGMLKFGERDKAFELYSANVKAKADVETFIDLVTAAGQTGPASAEHRLQSVVELLKDFKKSGQAPCLAIFRSAILATAMCARNRFGQEFAFKVLAEMAAINLNPCHSPALIAALLEIFYPSQSSSPSGFLPTLLTFLESSFTSSSLLIELRDQHPRDRGLASNLMLKACDIFRDADMAVRIHNLLSDHRPNLLQFVDVNRETAYYSALLSTLANGDTVERLMDVYSSVVPSRWLPSPNVFAHIVDAVELQRQFHLLPMLWQDAVKMRLPYGFPMLTDKFVVALEKASSIGTDLSKSLVSIALNMLDHAEYAEVARLNRGVSLTPASLGRLMRLSMSEKIAADDAVVLGTKVGAHCQRLRLTAPTVMKQHRRTEQQRQSDDSSKSEGKKKQDLLAHFLKLAAITERTLPPSFESWLKGGNNSNAATEDNNDESTTSHQIPRSQKFSSRRQFSKTLQS